MEVKIEVKVNAKLKSDGIQANVRYQGQGQIGMEVNMEIKYLTFDIRLTKVKMHRMSNCLMLDIQMTNVKMIRISKCLKFDE